MLLWTAPVVSVPPFQSFIENSFVVINNPKRGSITRYTKNLTIACKPCDHFREKILDIEINEGEQSAIVSVSEDQQSLAIGKGGQNVRLAAKLTGWKIDIKSTNPRGEIKEEKVEETPVEIKEEK